MTIRANPKCLLLFALDLALSLTTGCQRAGSAHGVNTPSAPMAQRKIISLGRAEIQVPEDATVSMAGELNDAKLHVEQLPAGQTFAKVWAERLKQIGSGQGNDPGPGQTRIRKIYPASGSAGQMFYAQTSDPKVLLVIERWQMVGDYLVKGRMELQEKYFDQAEHDMPAVFASMSLDPARSREITLWGR